MGKASRQTEALIGRAVGLGQPETLSRGDPAGRARLRLAHADAGSPPDPGDHAGRGVSPLRRSADGPTVRRPRRA